MIVRNDDVAADTSLSHLEKFCSVCDRAGVRIMQAITPMGWCIPVDRNMTNPEIFGLARGVNFSDREDLIQFLKSRNDLIAVHGCYHTHEPSLPEIKSAVAIFNRLGLPPSYFVPPFNEGDYGSNIYGLLVSSKDAFSIESSIANSRRIDKASNDIGYLHSWRFDPDCSRIFINGKLKRQLTLDDLERILK